MTEPASEMRLLFGCHKGFSPASGSADLSSERRIAIFRLVSQLRRVKLAKGSQEPSGAASLLVIGLSDSYNLFSVHRGHNHGQS